MPDNLYLFSTIAASTAVTFGLRALPLAFIAKLRSHGFINYLALRMPLGIMVVLVAATLPAGIMDPAVAWPVAAALAATMGLHLLRRRTGAQRARRYRRVCRDPFLAAIAAPANP
ncbi:AzlD domain-containing protein [Glutamicibacter sp. ZJUTW]|uniref:AzlD domain-containing protein n=1 Tax=Glutamicibacter sp. ZJUTW TaxID=1155384 RepID=UPI001AEF44B8|nr:AzlD domain-containing protein [Glutamicibacter sp. ZJUTW]